MISVSITGFKVQALFSCKNEAQRKRAAAADFDALESVSAAFLLVQKIRSGAGITEEGGCGNERRGQETDVPVGKGTEPDRTDT